MSYDITISYPQDQSTEPGQLFLPGEPLPAELADAECAFCAERVADRTGNHWGVVFTTATLPINSEPIHLRCVTDGAQQFGIIGFALGPQVAMAG